MRLQASRLLHHHLRPLCRPLQISKPTVTPLPAKTMTTTSQLPTLPEVERLAPGCIRILAGNPGKFTLQGTNTYLLGTGASRLLIDTGEGRPSWLSALKRVLTDEKASLASVLLTHWHHDHVGGVPDVLRTWPGTRVYKHLPELQPSHGQAEKQQQEFLDIIDGQRFTVPGASLTAVHTPGHTVDHMVFAWEEDEEGGEGGGGGLFTGDNVLGHGTSVFEDLGAYVASLERMRGLYRGGSATGRAVGRRAYPGHGPVVHDGPAKIAEYIRHRGQREEQVVQTLRSDNNNINSSNADGIAAAGDGKGSGWTLMELVRSIYRDVPESLHPAAAGGVIQILQKLQREGKALVVEEDEQRWRLTRAASPGRSAL